MRINKNKAETLAGYEPQKIVDGAAATFAQHMEDKMRGRRERAPAWLQWALPMPQKHRLRKKAQKEFWAITGPGRRIQREADQIKELQIGLKQSIEAAKESDLVEIDEAKYQLLEIGLAATGGKY